MFFAIIESSFLREAAMLEKIFGKKSTGVVYIVCASVLLLSLIGAAVFFLANYPNSSLYALFVQALVTAFSLAAISAPIFIQKNSSILFRLLLKLPSVFTLFCFSY